MATTAEDIIKGAESLKKKADIHFARSEFTEAVGIYTDAVKALAGLRGWAMGETQVIRCLANQAQCFLKLEQFEQALNVCNFALTVPSVANEQHLWCKLLFRRALALESLKDYEKALASIDAAIGLGTPDNMDEARERIVSSESSV